MIDTKIKTYSKIVKLLWFFIKPKKKLLLILFIITFLCGFIETLNVALIYPVINYGVGADDNLFIFDYMSTFVNTGINNPFITFTILLAVVSCLNLVAQFILVLFSSYTVGMINKANDESVFNRFTNETYRFFTDNKQGELIYIGSSATHTVGMVANYLVQFLKNSMMAIFFVIFLFLLSFKGAVIAITFGIFYTYLNKQIIYKRIYRSSSILTRENQKKSVIYNEFITGIKTIKIFNDFDFWIHKYLITINTILKNYIKVSIYQQAPSIFTNFLMFIAICGSAMYIYTISSGNIIPYLPLFGTFILALYRLLPALQGCLLNIAYTTQYLPNLELIYNLFAKYDIKETAETELESKLATNINSNIISNFDFEKSISFVNITFSYNNGAKKILDNISFNINKNKITAIVGPSGAGKSTIVNLLTQLYEPNSGELKIDGLNIKELNKNSFLRKIGYIGQETFIFNNTIKENIRFGLDLEQCTDEQMVEAAKLANAHEFIMETENGYETIIGDMGMKLSGGQRQRLAIARALLRKPELLILDEATSSLDTTSEMNVMEAINNISREATLLIIAHRLSTIQNADTIYVLKNGKVVESGTHEQLIGIGGEYYNLYQTQDEK
jgi:ATP-binding cassette subfamily B protein